MKKSIILSVSIEKEQADWLNRLNENLETKYGVKFGISAILQKTIEQLQRNIPVYLIHIVDDIVDEKILNKKENALKSYFKTTKKIEETLIKKKIKK